MLDSLYSKSVIHTYLAWQTTLYSSIPKLLVILLIGLINDLINEPFAELSSVIDFLAILIKYNINKFTN